MGQNVGLMAARRPLPDAHHVMRFVAPSKRYVDENGIRQGPSPAGFQLNAGDKGGLSVTEIEHFGQFSAATRTVAATAHRSSLVSNYLSRDGIFAWANIAEVKAAALSYDRVIRVVHDPVNGNPGHAEVRHFTDEDLDLLEFFATDVFREFETVAVMNLP